MSTLLTVDDMREHVTTSLGDDALERIINDNEAAIEALAGPLGASVTEVHWTNGYESIIFLKRRPQITDSPATPLIIEGYGYTDPVTLDTDDYYLDGYTLRRKDFGTNPGIWFTSPVAVTYTPVDDTDTRIGVLIALTKLE